MRGIPALVFQAGNLEKCRLLMRNMIETGDIAVPALYPGIVHSYSRADKCFRLDYVDVNGQGWCL
jgi:hypothetical protein